MLKIRITSYNVCYTKLLRVRPFVNSATLEPELRHGEMMRQSIAADRHRRAALPDRGDRDRRDGAAPGAHAVPALQAQGRAQPFGGRGGLGRARRTLEVEPPDIDLQTGGLSRVPHDRNNFV